MNTLRFDRDGPVGWLRLDRPERLNAFTIEMWEELRDLGMQLRDDAELRALVVIGEGRAFSSGIDTSVFGSGFFGSDGSFGSDAGSHADPMVGTIQRAQESYTWLEEAPFATIAAVRGYALGAGLQLALACDLRVLARGTRVGLLELKYGISPDLGGTQRLPRLVGQGKAKELVFTAEQIDAEEALRIGIAERVVEDELLESEVAALAAAVAAQPPLAIRAAKRAINAAGHLSVRDGLLVEAEGQAVCLRSADMAEALAALLEQRTPEYRGK